MEGGNGGGCALRARVCAAAYRDLGLTPHSVHACQPASGGGGGGGGGEEVGLPAAYDPGSPVGEGCVVLCCVLLGPLIADVTGWDFHLIAIWPALFYPFGTVAAAMQCSVQSLRL